MKLIKLKELILNGKKEKILLRNKWLKNKRIKKLEKTRTVTKTVDAESFFNFFKTTTAAGAKTGGEDDEDDE